MKLTKLILLSLFLLTSSRAMATFCQNDPVNGVDPLGLTVAMSESNVTAMKRIFGERNIAVGLNQSGKSVVSFANSMSAYDYSWIFVRETRGDNLFRLKLYAAIADNKTHQLADVESRHTSRRDFNFRSPYVSNEYDGYNLKRICGLDAQMAQLAVDVYNQDSAPSGWTRISSFGGNPGFFAALYKRDSDDLYVLSFRGTHDLNDWKNNFAQGLGRKAPQYERAIDLAAKMRTEVTSKGGRFLVAGHSLGGGLASAAALSTGSAGVTFNAAGLHGSTMERHGGNLSQGNSLLTAYVVHGEILNWLQSDVWGINWIMPNASGVRFDVAPPGHRGRVSLHFGQTVLDVSE